MDETLTRCLGMLKGPSDEHKFAGLLILSKIFQVENSIAAERFEDVMKSAVEAVGVNFLIRLAKSEPELTVNLMEKLSYVGSQLAPLEPFLKGTPEQLLPILCRIQPTTTSSHLLDMLFAFAYSLDAELREIEDKRLEQQQEQVKVGDPAEEQQTIGESEIQREARERATTGFELVRSILLSRINEVIVFKRAVEEFAKPSALQLYLVPVLSEGLPPKPVNLPALQHGISGIFKGKLKKAFRDNVYVLCSRLFDLYGPSWLSGENAGKDVTFLVRLCYIEVKMSVDLGESPELAIVCLSLLDEVLAALVDEEFTEWNIDSPTINFLRETFNDTARLLTGFLQDEGEEFTENHSNVRNQLRYHIFLFLSRLVLEDEHILRPEIFEIFPQILDFLFDSGEVDEAKSYVCFSFLASLLADPAALPHFQDTKGVSQVLDWLLRVEPSHPGYIPASLCLVQNLHLNPPSTEKLLLLIRKVLAIPFGKVPLSLISKIEIQTLLLLTELFSCVPRKASDNIAAESTRFVDLLNSAINRFSGDALFLDYLPILLQKLIIISTRHTLGLQFDTLLANLKRL